MSNSGPKECCYRSEIIHSTSQVVCRRLLQIADIQDQSRALIDRDACQFCGGVSEPDKSFFNDVLASLLFRFSREVIAAEGIEGCSVDRAQDLLEWATAGLRVYRRPQVQFVTQRTLPSIGDSSQLSECDVIMNLTAEQHDQSATVESILRQTGCHITLHLAVQAGWSPDWFEHLGLMENIEVHEFDNALSDFDVVHEIVKQCRSDFIAIQTANSISEADRISFAINLLIQKKGEIFGSYVETANGIIQAESPYFESRRTIPIESLVFRRTTYLDHQISCQNRIDDIEFVHQCYSDRRKVVLAEKVTVSQLDLRPEHRTQSTRDKKFPISIKENLLREKQISCDVVLPFRDHLDFVEEAIESILAQEDCDFVLHLIDDDSREPTDQFLDRWNHCSKIRCYRNEKNLGQYTSFNNVVPYLETDYVAIQDGDDISLPRRLTRAVNRLIIANADIYSGAMQVFGEEYERFAVGKTGEVKRRRVHQGAVTYPIFPRDSLIHFALNGTVVMRVSKFKELGGFTNYGSSQRNRAGLDTEFYLRAYHSARATFFMSNKIAIKVRRHAASATQTEGTGHGSPLRIMNRQELKKRLPRFRQADFDAREFGALGKFQELTQPWRT